MRAFIKRFFFLAFFLFFQPQNCIFARDDKNAINLSAALILCREISSKEIENESSASDNEGDVLLPYANGKLELLNAADWSRFWISELGGDITSNIELNGNGDIFVVLKNNEGYLLKTVSKTTGILQWQTKFNNSAFARTDDKIYSRIYNNRLILIFQSGEIYVVETETGAVVDSANAGRRLTSLPFFAETDFIVSTEENRILIFSISDAALERKFDARGRTSSVAAKPPEALFAGDAEGGVYGVNLRTNKTVWRVRASGAQISDITLTQYGILVSSYDNFLYMLAPADGKRLWKIRMSGKISYKPLIVGGTAVAVSIFAESAAVIDLKTGKIINRFTLEAGNLFSGITPLFDGNRFIFPTVKGLAIFSDSQSRCLNQPQ